MKHDVMNCMQQTPFKGRETGVTLDQKQHLRPNGHKQITNISPLEVLQSPFAGMSSQD